MEGRIPAKSYGVKPDAEDSRWGAPEPKRGRRRRGERKSLGDREFRGRDHIQDKARQAEVAERQQQEREERREAAKAAGDTLFAMALHVIDHHEPPSDVHQLEELARTVLAAANEGSLDLAYVADVREAVEQVLTGLKDTGQTSLPGEREVLTQLDAVVDDMAADLPTEEVQISA